MSDKEKKSNEAEDDQLSNDLKNQINELDVNVISKIMEMLDSSKKLDRESKSYKDKRGKLFNAIKKDLKDRGAWVEPHIDRVNRYMDLWDTSQMLADDINRHGVSIKTKTGLKKNDSVSQLNATNKQMDLMLEKMQINIPAPIKDGGEDI